MALRHFQSLLLSCLAVTCLAEVVNADNRFHNKEMTSTDIIIVSAGGSVILFLMLVLIIMLCRRCRQGEPNVTKDEEVAPYATVHISGILAPNPEHKVCGIPRMYENPLKPMPFRGRLVSQERLEQQLLRHNKSPYENIDHLGRPYGSSLSNSLFQRRHEYEDNNEPCDVLVLKTNYEKLVFIAKKKEKERCTPAKSGNESGLPTYDYISSRVRVDSCNSRDIDTILEEPSCDERSTLDRAEYQEHITEVISDVEESDGTVSLEDIDFSCVGTDWQNSTAQSQSLASSEREDSETDSSRPRVDVHMDDQTGLFGFYKSELSQHAKA